MIQQPPEPTYIRGNRRVKINHRIFAISLIIVQIIVSASYGFYGSIQINILNLNSVFTAILLAFLAVVGFGMYFGSLKSLLWGSIGFSFLITAISIQVYPLVNVLLAKGNIHSNQVYSDSFSNKNFSVFLANIDNPKFQDNNITSAIKCGLAIIIAFGSVVGRVGPLECLIMTVIGNFGYELNRSIIIDIGQDIAGTFSIFTFGGFLGLTFGILMALREKRNSVATFQHPMLVGGKQTISHSIIGVFFILILFPFLVYESDQSLQASFFQRYISPISVVLAMGSSIISSFGTGLLINGDKFKGIRIKDIMNSLVAGGIIVGAASFYITTPFLAIIIGSIAGLFQYILDNYFEKQLYKKFGLISISSYTLFCIQSLIGAIFAAGYNVRMTNQSNGFIVPSNIKNAAMQIVIYLISAGFGIGCGAITGISCYFVNKYKTSDMFTDRVEFIAQDGIHYFIQKKKTQEKKEEKKEGMKNTHEPPNSQKVGQDKKSQGQKSNKPPSHQSQVEVDISQISQMSDFYLDFADMLQVTMQ